MKLKQLKTLEEVMNYGSLGELEISSPSDFDYLEELILAWECRDSDNNADEEDIYDNGYDNGYEQGFNDGYCRGREIRK